VKLFVFLIGSRGLRSRSFTLVSAAFLVVQVAAAEPTAKGQILFRDNFEAASRQADWQGPTQYDTGFQSPKALYLEHQTTETSPAGLISRRLPIANCRGCLLRVSAMIKASQVSSKPQSWNGIKLMLIIETPTAKSYPQAEVDTGSFDWRRTAFTARIPTQATNVILSLGLEQVNGKVWFDDLQLAIAKGPPPVRPDPAPDLTPAFRQTTQRRGVMVSPQATPEDLRTLGLEWKANLIRWQLIRYLRPQAQPPLDEYDAWLAGELEKLDTALIACERYGLQVVVDLHSPPGGKGTTSGYLGSDDRLFTDPKAQAKFVEVWRRMAARYKHSQVVWGYDLANEPVEQYIEEGCDDWHDLAERAARAIREFDSRHVIIVEAPPWGSPESLADFTPLTVSNVVYSVHMYVPMEFTHQGVFNPAGKSATYPGVINGRTWNREALAAVLKPVVDFQATYRIPIYIGEFSAIRWAPDQSAYRYLKEVIELFEEYGWDWSYHAFREWQGWSVEHTEDRSNTQPSATPTLRRQLLCEWFSHNKKPTW
jgi:endoglucanase